MTLLSQLRNLLKVDPHICSIVLCTVHSYQECKLQLGINENIKNYIVPKIKTAILILKMLAKNSICYLQIKNVDLGGFSLDVSYRRFSNKLLTSTSYIFWDPFHINKAQSSETLSHLYIDGCIRQLHIIWILLNCSGSESSDIGTTGPDVPSLPILLTPVDI